MFLSAKMVFCVGTCAGLILYFGSHNLTVTSGDANGFINRLKNERYLPVETSAFMTVAGL